MNTKLFKVASVSSNTNSFGLYGMILIAQNGEAWEVGANYLNVKKKGDIVHGDNWASYGFEIPRQLKPDAPKEVVKEVWKVEKIFK